MTDDSDRHLELLSIFHYVVAGLTVVFSLFGLIYVGVGAGMLFRPESFVGRSDPPPAFLGPVLLAVGIGWVVCSLAFAVLLVLAGVWLRRHRRYLFCLVIAALACMLMPFGTVLGVFTIVVLMKSEVKARFQPAALNP